jgi:hypothetical protein
VESELYYERLNTIVRAEDGVALARPLERCGHQHETIAVARTCERVDLDDIGEFSGDSAYYRYVDAGECDDSGDVG